MDRDERDVRCYLRRVPMVGMPVDDLTEGLDNGTRKLGAVSQHHCARNTTNALPATGDVVSHRSARHRNIDSLTHTGACSTTRNSLAHTGAVKPSDLAEISAFRVFEMAF